MFRCVGKGCRQDATWRPLVIAFFPEAVADRPSPVGLRPSGMWRCGPCKKKTDDDAILDVCAWRWIDAAYEAVGIPAPERYSVRVTWEEI